MNELDIPYLYILMRNDLPSMNPGKAMAQAAHAANQFVYDMKFHIMNDFAKNKTDHREDLDKWSSVTEGMFGTTIVLSVNLNQLETSLYVLELCGYPSNSIEDETYPYMVNTELSNLIPSALDTSERVSKDDKVFLTRNEVTCGYAFGYKSDPVFQSIIKHFPLHP